MAAVQRSAGPLARQVPDALVRSGLLEHDPKKWKPVFSHGVSENADNGQTKGSDHDAIQFSRIMIYRVRWATKGQRWVRKERLEPAFSAQ
jgi:hypothetical protein